MFVIVCFEVKLLYSIPSKESVVRAEHRSSHQGDQTQLGCMILAHTGENMQETLLPFLNTSKKITTLLTALEKFFILVCLILI